MKEFDTKNRPLSQEQLDRLARLDALPDEDIDLSDIPEITEEQWAGAIRPGLGREGQVPVAVFLDWETLRWFKDHAHSKTYQDDLSQILRAYKDKVERKRA